MDSFRDWNSIFISNAFIENISFDRNISLITVSYNQCPFCRKESEQIVLIVDRNTTILNENGNVILPRELAVGMTINAMVSSAMTRSIPPQAQAFHIRVVRRMPAYETTTGRIIEVDGRNKTITTINTSNPSSVIRFQITDDTVLLNQRGRVVQFSRLMPGLRVRIEHANFMTASIPPQTTAFVIQLV